MSDRPGFTGSPLDRADAVRNDSERLAAALADPDARVIRLQGLDPELDADHRLVWDRLADLEEGGDLALLGFHEGRPHLARLVPVPHGARRSPVLFQMLGHMPDEEASTYAAARSLVDWHARHGFCAACGTPTAPERGGWLRRCGACNTEHYPRTDPVVIMLAEHEGRALVGRQPSFPAGSYSALAGFVEVGESIEEAVARELKEEAGVVATGVRYVASQPWPFPSSLMIGAIAPVESAALEIDRTELEDARWVTRDEVATALAGDPGTVVLLPPRYAIAHTLFKRWLAGA